MFNVYFLLYCNIKICITKQNYCVRFIQKTIIIYSRLFVNEYDTSYMFFYCISQLKKCTSVSKQMLVAIGLVTHSFFYHMLSSTFAYLGVCRHNMFVCVCARACVACTIVRSGEKLGRNSTDSKVCNQALVGGSSSL